MIWLLLFLCNASLAAVVIPLHYDTNFVLPTLPILRQLKFLDLPAILHIKRSLGMDLSGLLPLLGPINVLLPANLNLNIVLDKGWNLQTVIGAAQGTPNAWHSKVKLGTPPQALQLVLDSGSADFVVYDPSCRTCVQASQRNAYKTPYRSIQSSTFKRLNVHFEAHYGSSNFGLEGFGATDTISLPYTQIKSQTLAVVTNTSTAYNAFSHDGLIGLAQMSMSAIPGTRTVFDNLIKQNKIEQPLVGIALKQSLSGDGGEYSFGGINYAYVKGPISYFRVTSSLYWGTALEDIAIGQDSVLASADASRVIFDTGTTLVLVSTAVAEAINSQIPGAFYNADIGRWFVPCTEAPFDVLFTLGGKQWRIPGRDLAFRNDNMECLAGIQGGMESFFVLGDIFIKNHYLVLHSGGDGMNGKHVGLGLRSDL